MLFLLLIDVKVPMIVGISTFMSRKNFMLHGKSFITLGPDLVLWDSSKNFLLLPAFEAGNDHWKFVSYFGVFPITFAMMYNVFWVHWDLDEEDEPLDPEVKGMNMQRKVQ